MRSGNCDVRQEDIILGAPAEEYTFRSCCNDDDTLVGIHSLKQDIVSLRPIVRKTVDDCPVPFLYPYRQLLLADLAEQPVPAQCNGLVAHGRGHLEARPLVEAVEVDPRDRSGTLAGRDQEILGIFLLLKADPADIFLLVNHVRVFEGLAKGDDISLREGEGLADADLPYEQPHPAEFDGLAHLEFLPYGHFLTPLPAIEHPIGTILIMTVRHADIHHPLLPHPLPYEIHPHLVAFIPPHYPCEQLVLLRLVQWLFFHEECPRKTWLVLEVEVQGCGLNGNGDKFV